MFACIVVAHNEVTDKLNHRSSTKISLNDLLINLHNIAGRVYVASAVKSTKESGARNRLSARMRKLSTKTGKTRELLSA